MKKNIKRTILSLVMLWGVGISLVAIVANVYALSRFHGKESQCLASSGGRSGIGAVQYACQRAARTSNNGCALWIGSASTNGGIVIYAKNANTTVPAAFWGMCTDYADTTRAITVKNDNDSIADNMNLTRGRWAAPRSVPTTINVAKFISGARVTSTSDCYKEYTRDVIVGRYNGESGNYDERPATVKVRVGNNNKECTQQGNLCKLWNNGYSSSSSTSHTSGSTSIIVKARNMEARFGSVGSGAWSHREEIVYAKPGDTVQWHSCYYPGVQKTTTTLASDINGTIINGGTGGGRYVELDTVNCMSYQPRVSYKELRKGYDEKIGTWENKYNMNPGDLGAGGGSWGIGDSSVREHQGTRGIGGSNGGDVGRTLVQKGVTGKPVSASVGSRTPSVQIWKNDGPCYSSGYEEAYFLQNGTYPPPDPMNCPKYHCTNSYANDIKSASVNNGPTSDYAKVIVPYNYDNTTGVKMGSKDVYAGENSAQVTDVWVKVGPKYNGITIANYATVVPEIKVKLFMYVSDSSDGGGGGISANSSDGCSAVDAKQCIEVKSNDGKEVTKGPVAGGSKTSFSKFNNTYNSFDASAGDYLCFVSAVWPASSGADNSTDPNGDNLWKYGEPACKVIAKRPTFQVWGGSMFSQKSISASHVSSPAKLNVYSVTYNADNTKSKFYTLGGTNHYYTPWVEESLIVNSGVVAAIDSGAGSSNKNGRTKTLCSGGIWLTFANNPCTTGGESSKIPSGVSSNNDRVELINYWITSTERTKAKDNTSLNKAGKTITLADSNSAGAKIATATNATIRYVYANGSMAINKSNIGASKTFLVEATGTVTINGNITYPGTYKTMAQVPKVIIYAKNVNIKCEVTEVDAIIITKTDGTVKTCSNGGDNLNSAARSKQLKIVGMVIADKVELGRTYGAAASKDGGVVPATKNSGASAPNSNNVPAEIFDYDSTMPMWEEAMAGSAETDTYETSYSRELAPRY